MLSRTNELAHMLEEFHRLRMCLLRKAPSAANTLRLTNAQWLVIGVVAREKRISLKGLSTALHITPSAATQVARTLIEGGYLQRQPDPNDKRSVYLALLPKTQKAFLSMQRTALKSMTKLFSALSDREFKEYLALHRKLIQNCRP